MTPMNEMIICKSLLPPPQQPQRVAMTIKSEKPTKSLVAELLALTQVKMPVKS
jgi:hypothetical protein